MNNNQIDVKVEFWKEQFKSINWSHEYSLNKKEVLDFQSTRQVICARLGQTALNKEQREAIIESFRGADRVHVQESLERYALKD